MRSGGALRILTGAMLAGISAGCMTESTFICAPDAVLPDRPQCPPWVRAVEPTVYDSSNLEEYINGGARPYLEYGMTQLIHAVYVNGNAPSRRMVVDVYEMVSPLAAYGIYSTQLPENPDELRLGAAGFWSEGLLCFVKDRIFVSIEPPGEGPRGMASAMFIAQYIDGRITLPAALPAMIRALPEEDRVKHSERYLAKNMLGHRFLGGGWQATYRYRGVTHELFVIPCEGSGEALQRYEALADHITKNGKVVRRIEGVGRAALVGTDESLGRAFVTCSGKLLVGTIDCFDDARSIGLCRKVIENVTRMGL